MICDFKIGKRIECGGYYGTIKFVGPVEGYQGVWLGIDWGDPDRGKHNGIVNDVHYFNARYPTSGSFVRKEKVDFGISLIDSIRSRYGCNDDEQTCKQNEQQLLKFQKDINAPFLQFVGFDKVANKQKNFHNLEVVNVRTEKVSSIGEPLELYSLCPNLKELDVSKTLLSSWVEVFEICSQLPRLYWINVSENVLLLPENHIDYYLPNITVLICGNMHLMWEDIIKLSKCLPNVEELRVPFNDIQELCTPQDHNFQRLQYLDFEGNFIGSWSEVNKLSVIETLEHLNLENTNLENIFFESHTIPVPDLSNLNTLNLNDNKIYEWKSVGELNKLKSLNNLRFTRNPVLEKETPATREQIMIAKIKNLQMLNGSLIQEDVRKGAEYDYLKKYALDWLKVQNTDDRNAFLVEHNRYLEFIDRYGFPEESELKVQSNLIASSLITVRVQCDEKTVTKKFPPSILVQKLVTLVQKIFRLQDRPTLRRVSGTDADIVVDLDDEMKELGYYSIQEGDTLVVQKQS